jgi:hypothetical protein
MVVDRTVVLRNAQQLVKAEEEIIEGLGPIVDDWLKEFHHSKNDFIEKENKWRQEFLKNDKDPLYPDADGAIVWDYSVLLRTMIDHRWNDFIATRRRRKVTIANKQEIYLDIKVLLNLRDKSLAHRHMGRFTERDFDELFIKSERVLRSLGAPAQAEKLRPVASDNIDGPQELRLGNLNFRTVETYPQWAATPKIVSLPNYRRSSITIRGLFSSASPYFRFGFKLMKVSDSLFGPGSVQTDAQNMLVHVGKNIPDSDLFLTAYQSGIRLGKNRVLMQFAPNSILPMSFELTKEGIIRLNISDALSYEAYFCLDGIVQVAILAWGDEHYFECDFKEATIAMF